MSIWWAPSDGHYEYPQPYEDNVPRPVRWIEQLAPNDHHCPHCHTNNASLQKDDKDLYCFICGWRDTGHFNPKLQKWINWIEMTERKHGAPILLSTQEERELESKRQSNDKRKEKAAEYTKAYRELNREQLKKSKHDWYFTNRDTINQQRREKRAFEKVEVS